MAAISLPLVEMRRRRGHGVVDEAKDAILCDMDGACAVC